jgi:3-oxoacyl-ACP reductase-like protein
MDELADKIIELQHLSDNELRKLRKIDHAVDKFMTEVYKLVDLDKVRKKAIKTYLKDPVRKKKTKKNALSQHMPRDGTNCYVCHTFVKESERKPMHESSKFQGMICTDCKTLTQYYLDIDLDLKGKVCIVTGARVKIGYHIVLWLLRHGATVVGTTRFPMDAQERYARESDYDTWSENLQLIEVDFRSSWMIANFCNIVKEKCQSLYLLVNNAAQTIKRPEYFYRDLTDRKLAITGTSAPCVTISVALWGFLPLLV